MWKQRTKTREADIHESVVSHFLFCFGDDIGRWDPNFALTSSKMFNWFETTSCRWMSHETTDPLLTINLSPILNYSPTKSKAHIIKNSLGPNLGHLWSSTWCTSPKPNNWTIWGLKTHIIMVARQTKNIQKCHVFGSFRSTIDPIHPQRNPLHSWIGYLIWELNKSCPKKHIDKPWYTQVIDSQTAQAWPNFLVFPFGQAPQRGRSVAAMSNTALEVRLFRRCRWLALKLAGVAW